MTQNFESLLIKHNTPLRHPALTACCWYDEYRQRGCVNAASKKTSVSKSAHKSHPPKKKSLRALRSLRRRKNDESNDLQYMLRVAQAQWTIAARTASHVESRCEGGQTKGRRVALGLVWGIQGGNNRLIGRSD